MASTLRIDISVDDTIRIIDKEVTNKFDDLNKKADVFNQTMKNVEDKVTNIREKTTGFEESLERSIKRLEELSVNELVFDVLLDVDKVISQINDIVLSVDIPMTVMHLVTVSEKSSSSSSEKTPSAKLPSAMDGTKLLADNLFTIGRLAEQFGKLGITKTDTVVATSDNIIAFSDYQKTTDTITTNAAAATKDTTTTKSSKASDFRTMATIVSALSVAQEMHSIISAMSIANQGTNNQKTQAARNGAVKTSLVGIGAAVGTAVGVGPVIGAGLGSMVSNAFGDGISDWIGGLINARDMQDKILIEMGQGLERRFKEYKSIAQEINYAEDLKEEYNNLYAAIESNELPTEDLYKAQLKIKDIATELNRLFPDLCQGYDRLTGTIGVNTGAITNNLDKLNDYNEVQFQTSYNDAKDSWSDTLESYERHHNEMKDAEKSQKFYNGQYDMYDEHIQKIEGAEESEQREYALEAYKSILGTAYKAEDYENVTTNNLITTLRGRRTAMLDEAKSWEVKATDAKTERDTVGETLQTSYNVLSYAIQKEYGIDINAIEATYRENVESLYGMLNAVGAGIELNQADFNLLEEKFGIVDASSLSSIDLKNEIDKAISRELTTLLDDKNFMGAVEEIGQLNNEVHLFQGDKVDLSFLNDDRARDHLEEGLNDLVATAKILQQAWIGLENNGTLTPEQLSDVQSISPSFNPDELGEENTFHIINAGLIAANKDLAKAIEEVKIFNNQFTSMDGETVDISIAVQTEESIDDFLFGETAIKRELEKVLNDTLTEVSILETAWWGLKNNDTLTPKELKDVQSIAPGFDLDALGPEKAFDAVNAALINTNEKLVKAINEINTFNNEFIAMDGEKIDVSIAVQTTQSMYDLLFGGGLKARANGGILTGPEISLVGEDGPEAIIPLSGKRRQRGLNLWQEAGKMLGVTHYADGGIIGSLTNTASGFGILSGITQLLSSIFIDSEAEGEVAPISTIQSAQKNDVQVNVQLSPTFQVNQEGGVAVNTIKAQLNELIDDMAGEIADKLNVVFSNMPMQA